MIDGPAKLVHPPAMVLRSTAWLHGRAQPSNSLPSWPTPEDAPQFCAHIRPLLLGCWRRSCRCTTKTSMLMKSAVSTSNAGELISGSLPLIKRIITVTCSILAFLLLEHVLCLKFKFSTLCCTFCRTIYRSMVLRQNRPWRSSA